MKMVKCIAFAFAALLTMGSSLAQAQSLSPSTKWHWNKGSIEIETPARPAGQKDVIGLELPKIKKVRIGLVGLGMRGPGAVENFCVIPGVEVVALCDYVPERAEACQQYLRKAGLAPAAIYSGENGYKELCQVLPELSYIMEYLQTLLQIQQYKVMELPQQILMQLSHLL